MAADSAVRGRFRTAVVLLVMAALAAAATSRAQVVEDQRAEELRERSERARAEAAMITADIAAHAAEADEIEAAIRALAADIDANREAHATAGRSLGEAERARDGAAALIAGLEEDRARTVDSLRRAAVEAFMEFGGTSDFQDFIEDPWGSTWIETLAEFGTGSGSEELDRFRAIDAQLDEQRRIAEEAAAEARQLQEELDAEKDRLDEALSIREQLQAEIDALIDDLLIEAAALEDLAAALDDEAARAEAEAIAAQKRAEQARLGATLNELPGNGGPAGSDGDNPGGDSSGDPGDGGDPDGDSGSDLSVPKPETTVVWGIEVASSIAGDVEGLLTAMEAEGFRLTGGGYRSHERQIELRKKHCGTSHEAIWEWPARRCRPPTARPGQSNHEKGLAIDFTYQGRLLRSRSSDVYRALASLAAEYNFRNLPSEAWHWDHTSAR